MPPAPCLKLQSDSMKLSTHYEHVAKKALSTHYEVEAEAARPQAPQGEMFPCIQCGVQLPLARLAQHMWASHRL